MADRQVTRLDGMLEKLDEDPFEIDLLLSSDAILGMYKLKDMPLSSALMLHEGEQMFITPLNPIYNIGAVPVKDFNFLRINLPDMKRMSLGNAFYFKDIDNFKESHMGHFQKTKKIELAEMKMFENMYDDPHSLENEVLQGSGLGNFFDILQNINDHLLDFFTLGEESKRRRKYHGSVAERCLSWAMVSELSKKSADSIEDYLKQVDVDEKDKANMQKISSFYHNLSYHSSFGEQRLKEFLGQVTDTFKHRVPGLKDYSIGGIKEKIENKVYG